MNFEFIPKTRNPQFLEFAKSLNLGKYDEQYEDELESRFLYKENFTKLYNECTEKIKSLCSEEVNLLKSASNIEQSILQQEEPQPISGKEKDFNIAKEKLMKCQKPIFDVFNNFTYMASILRYYSKLSLEICLDDCESSFTSNNITETSSCLGLCYKTQKYNNISYVSFIGDSSKSLIEYFNTNH